MNLLRFEVSNDDMQRILCYTNLESCPSLKIYYHYKFSTTVNQEILALVFINMYYKELTHLDEKLFERSVLIQ